MFCQLKSLYICVKDMQRAIAFYENLIQQPVIIQDDIYSVFEINGFRLGLFAYQKENEDHYFGSNCLPSFEFENIEILKKQIEGKIIHFPLKQIKDYWVVEIMDSEGNPIECTAPIKKNL